MKFRVMTAAILSALLAACGGGASSNAINNATNGAANSATAPAANVMASKTPTVTGATFYVSPSGSDSNAGTLAAPFKTLQNAVNHAGAGTTIYARAGVYGEQVSFPHSGNATTGVITLRNYPGETPVIDGTSIGTKVQNQALVNLSDVSYITVNGFEIRNFTSNTASFVPVGIFVTGSGSNIQLLNNYVHNITTTVNNDSGDALGIAVYGSEAPASINNIVISGNQLAYLKTGSSESMALSGNVENFTITNNTIHDNNNIGIDLAGFENVAPNAAYDQVRNGEVSGNLVYNITAYGNPAYGDNYGADGIYVDGGTQIVIERNTVHNVDIGAEMASEHKGHVGSYITLRSNLLYNNNLTGISIGGADNNSNGGTDHCGIYNNTLYQNDTLQSGSGEITLQNHLTNNSFANNLIVSNSQGLFISSGKLAGASALTMDGDLYYAPNGVQPNWVWNNKTITSFASFVSATANDKHGFATNPQLINPAAGNFVPAAGSPAINAGVTLTAAQAGALDLAGHVRVQGSAIDIGAYEVQ